MLPVYFYSAIFGALSAAEATYASDSRHGLSASQELLITEKDKANDKVFRKGRFDKTRQSNATCPTRGESQWTGTADVSDDHRLFYWFFDSRNDPQNDPIIVWMNGGPGSSSMIGLFQEMGPCSLDASNIPAMNQWSWNNNASLLFLDQPAGTGFSTIAQGGKLPTEDADGAEDFQSFLNIFFEDIFPEKADLPIHIAAESHGGHMAPVYINHILTSRQFDSRRAFWGNITSMILVNAVIDMIGSPWGVYELLCSENKRIDILSTTACDDIRLKTVELERLGKSCDITYDGRECAAAINYGEGGIHPYYYEFASRGERSPFHVHKLCPDFPECHDLDKGNLTFYLNQPKVKDLIQAPDNFTFSEGNTEMLLAYRETGSTFRPTTREVSRILDEHRAAESVGDIRLLVINGNEDYNVNSPGNMWVYDNLRWSQQPDFRIKAWRQLPAGMGANGTWKATRDGRLAFVGVDGAGHMVPGDAREGSYRILQKWLDDGWSA